MAGALALHTSAVTYAFATTWIITVIHRMDHLLSSVTLKITYTRDFVKELFADNRGFFWISVAVVYICWERATTWVGNFLQITGLCIDKGEMMVQIPPSPP